MPLMKYVIGLLFCICFYASQAQYWFGPKFGIHRASFEYDNTLYKVDSFSVNESYGLQLGGVFVYEATSMYSVQTEITYKRINKKVENKLVSPIISNSTYNYLSIPFLLRVSFGSEPIHYFVGGGPEVNIWLGGKGDIKLDEFAEGPVGVLDENDGLYRQTYDVTYQQSKSEDNLWAIPNANRVQYTLTAVAGVYLDLVSNGRLLIEGRYMWGHSNLGFNDNPNFTWESYYENFEHRINMATISIAYLFHYDAKEARKGMSNLSESKQAEIKAKKKQKKSK